MVPPPRVLEISIVSGHDLALVSKSMKTYSVAWVDPERKLTTRVDQNGLNNPSWNEKFVFRVDDRFLTDETSAIMIEIYAAAWLKDALIGSVRVLISHLFGTLTHNSSSSTRYVALQVRRPSGRPQGILNLGITLLDNTMRSMPLFAELCGAGANFSEVSSGANDVMKPETTTAQNSKQPKDDQELERVLKPKDNSLPKAKLRRSQSDKTDLTSEDYSKNSSHQAQQPTGTGSVVTGSICNGGSVVKGSGSMVNGSQCSSDVGPSASVVAAAIAKGLYKAPTPPKTGAGGLVTEEWTAAAKESDQQEVMKSKVERWRTELPPIYDNSKMSANSKHGGRPRRRTDSGGLFSCFGNAFGCEISITCGGGNSSNKKKYQNGKVCNLSSVDDNSSQSYV